MPFENNDGPQKDLDDDDEEEESQLPADVGDLMTLLGVRAKGDDEDDNPSSDKLSEVAQQKKTGSLSKLPTQKPRKKGALET